MKLQISEHIQTQKLKMHKETQTNSCLNNVLYCCEISMSVNKHLNSSLSKAVAQPSVQTGIMMTATIVTIHTHAHTHTGNCLLAHRLQEIEILL